MTPKSMKESTTGKGPPRSSRQTTGSVEKRQLLPKLGSRQSAWPKAIVTLARWWPTSAIPSAPGDVSRDIVHIGPDIDGVVYTSEGLCKKLHEKGQPIRGAGASRWQAIAGLSDLPSQPLEQDATRLAIRTEHWGRDGGGDASMDSNIPMWT